MNIDRPAQMLLWAYVAIIAALLFAVPAHASTDPVKDTRQILAGTVTTTRAKNGYLSGANDRTTAFQGALGAYKAVRAAEPSPIVKCLDGTLVTAPGACPVPQPLPPVAEAPPPLIPAPWTAMATKTCPSGQKILDLPGLVCNPRPPVPPLTIHGVTLAGEAPIADNFDLIATSAVVYSDIANPVTGTWYGGVPAKTTEGGNFRFACLPGQLLKDDPLVMPGQPGASHIHQFWGNTQTNAFSTYQSLRTTGNSTCSNPINGPANRTAYWSPAMLDGAGNAVKPDVISAYYKQHPASDPACTDQPGNKCIPLPDGLRYAFGYDMKTGLGGVTDPASPVSSMVKWTCNKDEAGNAAIPGVFHTLAEMVAAGCPAGAKIFLMFVAPDCWDGNVAAADHRSNMSYPTRATTNGFRCPADHPYWTPNYSGFIVWTTDANFVAGKWHLSSDEMVPGVAAGTTIHFDYWEGWSPVVKATWQFYCIDQSLNCAGGELGDGTALNHDDMGPRASHQLVPLSSIP